MPAPQSTHDGERPRGPTGVPPQRIAPQSPDADPPDHSLPGARGALVVGISPNYETLQITDPQFFLRQQRTLHPYACVIAVVRNGVESWFQSAEDGGEGVALQDLPAAHVTVFAREHEGRRVVCVRDDGPGMTEQDVRRYVLALGSGAKPRGREKSLGVGLKLIAAVQNDNVIMTTWRDGMACRVVLGREWVADGEYYRPVVRTQELRDGDRVLESGTVIRVPVPQDAASPSGTEVLLDSLPFHGNLLVRELNQQLIRVPGSPGSTITELHGGRVENGRTTITGLLLGLDEVCERTTRGSVQVGDATVHYGITREVPEVAGRTRARDERRRGAPKSAKSAFEKATLVYAHRDQVFASAGKDTLTSLRDTWGIKVDAEAMRRVAIVVEVHGDRVEVSPYRNSVAGFDPAPVAAAFRRSMPRPLRDFIDDSRRRRAAFKPVLQRSFVMKLLAQHRKLSLPLGGEPGMATGTGMTPSLPEGKVETEPRVERKADHPSDDTAEGQAWEPSGGGRQGGRLAGGAGEQGNGRGERARSASRDKPSGARVSRVRLRHDRRHRRRTARIRPVRRQTRHHGESGVRRGGETPRPGGRDRPRCRARGVVPHLPRCSSRLERSPSGARPWPDSNIPPLRCRLGVGLCSIVPARPREREVPKSPARIEGRARWRLVRVRLRGAASSLVSRRVAELRSTFPASDRVKARRMEEPPTPTHALVRDGARESPDDGPGPHRSQRGQITGTRRDPPLLREPGTPGVSSKKTQRVGSVVSSSKRIPVSLYL